MRFLLDTHTLLWWLGEPAVLTSDALDAIKNASNQIYVSAASAWEIAIKKRLGKLEAPDDLEIEMEKNRFTPLSISFRHALALERLPPIHRDPFDRMLVVQARSEGLTVVTRDDTISRYEVPVVRA